MVKHVKCPKCGKKADWEKNKFRPFCSERCKIYDLGNWASEEYKFSESLVPTTELKIINNESNN